MLGSANVRAGSRVETAYFVVLHLLAEGTNYSTGKVSMTWLDHIDSNVEFRF